MGRYRKNLAQLDDHSQTDGVPDVDGEDAGGQHWCSCPMYCKVRQPVARSTFFKHKALRQAAERAQHANASSPSFPPMAGPSTLSGQGIAAAAAAAAAAGPIDDPMDVEQDEPDYHQPSLPLYNEPDSPLPSDNPLPPRPDEVPSPPPDNPDDTTQNDVDPSQATDPASLRQEHNIPPEPEPNDNGEDYPTEDARVAADLIQRLKNATIDEDIPDEYVRERLRNPPQSVPDINDVPGLALSISLFVGMQGSSRQMYNNVRDTILEFFPESSVMSYEKVKRAIEDISGVVSVREEMCYASCVAFVGPYADCEICPRCGESRYDQDILEGSNGQKKVARKGFETILLGPQLQALWRSKEGAEAMRYRAYKTLDIMQEIAENGKIHAYEDVFHGADYLAAVARGEINFGDMLLMLSVDGFQLYKSKESDAWLVIWVVLDLSPELRYKKKHVIPIAFIPGPKKPKNLDTFLFRALRHVAALQNEGLPIWDSFDERMFVSNLYFYLGTADSPGMAQLEGWVGHTGVWGCRTLCATHGRHVRGSSTYYSAHLKPHNFDVPGCDHDDVDVFNIPKMSVDDYKRNLTYVMSAPNETQFARRRKETGLTKPSIISGLPRSLGVPSCFVLDLMHVSSLNITELTLLLWRGTMDVGRGDDKSTWDWTALQDNDVWTAHGRRVAEATMYLPGIFDRPPRDPAEKANSGYKAKEFATYIFGLAPGLLYGTLDDKYWSHFCKLVYAIRLAHQRSITPAQVIILRTAIQEYIYEYELLYYQRKSSRIHFCRQCLHVLLHIADEIIRIGPLGCYAQWTIERTIGNLGEEVKQPSNPYANLSQRGLIRCQVNALKAMIPSLDRSKQPGTLPRGAVAIDDGYVLLRALENPPRLVEGQAGRAIHAFLENEEGIVFENYRPQIARWARLRLPNGQVVRSAWKEKAKPREEVRMARMVKLRLDREIRFAEVQFFFQAFVKARNETLTLAVVSMFSRHEDELLRKSYNTLWSCKYMGEEDLRVVEARTIQSVVGMIPRPDIPLGTNAHGDMYFVVEKLGLEIASMSGYVEDVADEE